MNFYIIFDCIFLNNINFIINGVFAALEIIVKPMIHCLVFKVIIYNNENEKSTPYPPFIAVVLQ